MKKTIAVFGVESVDLYRYNKIFFDNINNFNLSDNEVYLFCEERLSISEIRLFANIFENVNIIYTRFKTSKQLQIVFNNVHFDLLIINSYTIADIRILKSISVHKSKVIYLQHGLYLKYMPRKLFYYFSKPIKILSYLLYAIDVNGSFNVMRLINILRIYISGSDRKYLPKAYIKRVNINLVFSDYWERWHQSVYKIESPLLKIGYMDSYSHKSKQYSKHIVYCSQTLVEDGRISKKEMLKFYTCLKEISIKFDKKIVVRVHPRNSSWSLNIFENYDFSLEKDKIPVGDFTIGHYSTLLPIWGIFKSRILIFELPKHKTPESIKNISSKIVSYGDYQNFNETDLIDKSSEIRYYFGDDVLISKFEKLINA